MTGQQGLYPQISVQIPRRSGHRKPAIWRPAIWPTSTPIRTTITEPKLYSAAYLARPAAADRHQLSPRKIWVGLSDTRFRWPLRWKMHGAGLEPGGRREKLPHISHTAEIWFKTNDEIVDGAARFSGRASLGAGPAMFQPAETRSIIRLHRSAIIAPPIPGAFPARFIPVHQLFSAMSDEFIETGLAESEIRPGDHRWSNRARQDDRQRWFESFLPPIASRRKLPDPIICVRCDGSSPG